MSKNRFTVDPDHNCMVPEDFSLKVASVSNDYQSGTISDGAVLTQLERAYIRLDPVASAFPQHPSLLSSAFARSAEMTAAIAQTKGHEFRWRASYLTGTLLLDKIGMDLESEQRNGREFNFEEGLDALQRSQKFFRDAINLRSPQQYQHSAIGAVMGSLSARTMRVQIGDGRLHTTPTARRRAEIRDIQRSTLSGIILDSVVHMRNIHEEMRALPATRRSNHKGHLTEILAFTHNVMQWREYGIGTYSVRFALQREDHAGIQLSPRRTFDLMERRGAFNQPVEVKSSSTSYEYHPEIAHWRPNHPTELEQQYPIVIDSFVSATVSSGADERQEAQYVLDYHFKQP